MRITKYIHSCILVEANDLVAIFDPGVYSHDAFNFDSIKKLDYIFITHNHQDHLDIEFLQALLAKFSSAKVIGPDQVKDQLKDNNINLETQPNDDFKVFISPHESVEPLLHNPEECGFHYLDKLSVPGDSHSFTETKDVLALAITAPWGSALNALRLILALKPKYVVPLHDWHWSDEARKQAYDSYSNFLNQYGITMYKPVTGVPIEIPV